MESTTNNLVKTISETIPEKISTFEGESELNPTVDSTSVFSKLIMFFVIASFLFGLGVIIYIYFKKGELSFEEYITNKYHDFKDKMKEIIEYKKDQAKSLQRGVTGLQKGVTGYVGEMKEEVEDEIGETKQDAKRSIAKKLDLEETVKKCDNPKKEDLMKALDNAAQTDAYMADDASSSIQSVNKSRWCLIGEENGVRNCVKLDDSQKCMSGDIFPSNDVCINPNVRY